MAAKSINKCKAYYAHFLKWTPIVITLSFSVVMVLLAILGALRNFDQVPYWDMWSIPDFNIRVLNGDISVWWEQHNEHRIVLSRVLFWTDQHLFGGGGESLIIENFVLMGCAATVFWFALKDDRTEPHYSVSTSRIVLWLYIVAMLSLWTQSENINWGFQSSFFLAQLFPLCAFLLLAYASTSAKSIYFILACVVGLLSICTMVNGVLTLPLLAIEALILRLNYKRLAILVLLSTICLLAYFHDYKSPPNHGDFATVLLSEPVRLLNYTFLYLGSPVYYLLGSNEVSKVFATMAGLLIILIFLIIVFFEIISVKRSPIVLALLCYISYIVATAFGTGGGRLIFGLDQATSSRYTTPALMSMAAIIVAVFLAFNKRFSRAGRAVIQLIAVFFAALMLSYQVKALHRHDDIIGSHLIAALALALDIKDSKYISTVFPDVDSVLAIAKASTTTQFSIFGKYPFRNLKASLMQPPAELNLEDVCSGSLDRTEVIPGVESWVRVYGWIFNSEKGTSPSFLRLVNGAGVQIGYAVTGLPRNDVAKVVGTAALNSGFVGYLMVEPYARTLRIIGEEPSCKSAVFQALTAF